MAERLLKARRLAGQDEADDAAATAERAIADTNQEAAADRSDRRGLNELRKSPMMAHLMDALDEGGDIGHYGRLVFAMVARHFLAEEEVVCWLQKDPSAADAAQARSLVLQVQGRDYSPPKRQRILEWQQEQAFPICPDAHDPDACNVYKDLTFPDSVYESISEYYEEKAEREN